MTAAHKKAGDTLCESSFARTILAEECAATFFAAESAKPPVKTKIKGDFFRDLSFFCGKTVDRRVQNAL